MHQQKKLSQNVNNNYNNDDYSDSYGIQQNDDEEDDDEDDVDDDDDDDEDEDGHDNDIIDHKLDMMQDTASSLKNKNKKNNYYDQEADDEYEEEEQKQQQPPQQQQQHQQRRIPRIEPINEIKLMLKSQTYYKGPKPNESQSFADFRIKSVFEGSKYQQNIYNNNNEIIQWEQMYEHDKDMEQIVIWLYLETRSTDTWQVEPQKS